MLGRVPGLPGEAANTQGDLRRAEGRSLSRATGRFPRTGLVCLIAASSIALSAPSAHGSTALSGDCGGLPKLTVRPNPQLTIRGWIGEDDSFTGAVRLTAHRSGIQPFLLPSDLVAASKKTSGQSLGRNHIAIDEPATALPKSQLRDFLVKVTGIGFAGVYTGTVLVETEKMSCSLRLKVVARSRPSLVLVGAASGEIVKLRLSACTEGRCWPGEKLVNALLPSQSRACCVRIPVSNTSPNRVSIVDVRVHLRGDHGERVVSPLEFGFKPRFKPTVVGPGSRGLVTLTLPRDGLEPDHYVGTMYLTMRGGKAPIGFPLDLSVKDGPTWAVLALIATFIVVAVIRGIQLIRKRYGPVVRALRALRRRVRDMDKADQLLLLPMIAAARTLVSEGDPERANELVTSIEQRRKWLDDARRIESDVRGPGGTVPPEIQTPLNDLREAIRKQLDDLAKTKYGELTAAYGTWKHPSLAVAVAPMVLVGGLPPPPPPGFSFRDKIRRVLVFSSFHIAPPILYVIAFAALAFVGLKELYLNNDTFGANRLLDYGGLVTWGLGATFVGKGLTSLLPDAAS
jgi:hypothetical protein